MTETYPPIDEAFKYYFYTMGDVNKDGVIDVKDVALVTRAYGTADKAADINGDGIVDLKDVALVTRNYGKTIEGEWRKTVDKERLEAAAAAVGGVANVPWYIDWARTVAAEQAKNDQAYANWLDPAMQSFMDSLKELAALPDTFWKGNISNMSDIAIAQYRAGAERMILIFQALRGE